MIQLRFATNKIKIGPLEPEINPAKFAQRHYAMPMTSHDVIGPPLSTISLVEFYNCFLTVEDILKTHKKFQTIRYHADVVRGGCFSSVAPRSFGSAITPSPVKSHFFTFKRFHRLQV